MAAQQPVVTLDLSGLACPAPLLGAKKVVDDLEQGQTMLLISDCPGTRDDLFAWAKVTGNEVVTTVDLGGKKSGYTIRKGSGAAPPPAHVTLDMRGASCPGPILEAKKLLGGMKSGEVLQLFSNCPGTPADISAWVAHSRTVELIASQEDARGVREFYLRKK